MTTNLRLTFPHTLTNWIFPRRCLLCKKDLSTGNLCECCESLCHKCPNYHLSDKNDAALFYFEFSIKDLIKETKYNKKIVHAEVLKKLIKDNLSRSVLLEDLKTFSPSVITYVPTHWMNLIVRRSDVPELFAHAISRELEVPFRSLLIRKKFNSRQVLRANKKERISGVMNTFGLRSKKRRYERILLVDDIVTTGATMTESKKILRRIGTEVKCLALAKTPLF